MSTNVQAAEWPERPGSAEQRELEAVHQIAQAFLAANHPVEVYRLALARLTPVVRADFAAVFVRDEAEPDMLKPVCAQGWPQSSAKYLGHLRIRVGRGPTGRAVAENAAVEVANVFADPSLEDWWEPARELGFSSLITHPLTTPQGVNGAVSFYFVEPREFTDEERSLLRRISEQLAATSTRARAVEETRLELEQLRRDKASLEKLLRDRNEQAGAHDLLVLGACNELRATLDAALTASTQAANGNGAELLLRDAGRTIADLTLLLELRLRRVRVQSAAEDAVRLAKQALEAAGDPPAGVNLQFSALESIVPVRTDGPRVTRVLASLLALAYSRTLRGEIVFEISVRHDPNGGSVYWTIHARGMGLDSGAPRNGQADRTDLDLALAGELARALGGELWLDAVPAAGLTYRLRLPARHR